MKDYPEIHRKSAVPSYCRFPENRLKVESSAFAFVCLEISTLVKLENSCLLLFSEGLKFQALEGLKFQDKQTQMQMIQTYETKLLS